MSRGGAGSESSVDATIDDLCSFLDQSPTAYHVVASAARRLLDAGFVWFDNASELPDFTGSVVKGFVTRGGAIIAFVTSARSNDKFRIIGAHTDSPGLHLKSNPEGVAANFGTLEVEVYGSPLLNSWLDRDLDIAGHVVKRDGGVVLFRSASPVARLPQLAIHLDRGVNENGVVLDKHAHLRPVWSTGDDIIPVRAVAAHLAGVLLDDVATTHSQLVDHEPARLLGTDASLVASGRLDNQLSCWAAVDAITKLNGNDGVAVIALFDHEEVGSDSTTGAGGPMLEHLLERIAESLGKSRGEYLTMLPRSSCLSCDNAHAVHPNYQERHDHKHAPLINQGVALKTNSNQRYATSASSAVAFLAACESANVGHQVFFSRNNMPCGSTIGPITATRLGIDTVDVGVPQLSMHSAREVCGVSDAADLPKIARAFLRG
ncbi:MAG: M18 family aminopeptidase [Actinomycetota bacterium]